MTDIRREELPGLAAERTALSWDRTALALLVNGTLLLLRDVTPQRPAPLIAASTALLLALLCAFIGRRRARQIRGLRGGTAPPPTREIMVIGAGVTALGLAVAAFAVQ